MRLNAELIEYVVAGGPATAAVLRKLGAELDQAVGVYSRPGAPAVLPFLVDEPDHAWMRRTVEVLLAGLAAVPEAVFGDLDTAVRELPVPEGVMPFLTEDIPLSVRVTRSDFLHGPDGWRLGEINLSAGAAGLVVGDYDTVVRGCPPVAGFLAERGLANVSPLGVLVGAVVERCEGLDIAGRPLVAIVDWQGSGEVEKVQQERIARAYREHGFDAVLCHHREVRLRDGRLWYDRRPVHAVHRAFLLEDIPRDPASAMPVLEAAAAGAVVLISTFRDEWLANKAAFAVLHEARRRGLLDARTLQVITSAVPPTWLLAGPGARRRGPWLGLDEIRRRDPDGLVLKPVVGSGSVGVVLGAAVPDEAFWNHAELAAREARTHVVQDLVVPAPLPFPALDGDRIVVEPWQPAVGVFHVDGEYAGMWVRKALGAAPGTISTRHRASWSGGWAAA
jgi:hypothetical protein